MANILYVNASGRYVEDCNPCRKVETVYVGTKRYWELRKSYYDSGENHTGDELERFHKYFKINLKCRNIHILSPIGAKPIEY